MKSLKELYRIGPGPSSSHTMGPQKASMLFKSSYPDAAYYEAELYGSLSLTGKGHLTDYIIIETMKPKLCQVFFKTKEKLKHPNTMKLAAYDDKRKLIDEWIVYSIGGGAIEIEGKKRDEVKDSYPHHTLKEILDFCTDKKLALWQYVDLFDSIDNYIEEILDTMLHTVELGLHTEGKLPGRLNLIRVAKNLKQKADTTQDLIEKQKLLLSAYAYGACEENACGHKTVTAPTLGSSGILPSIVYYYCNDLNHPREEILRSLKVAGLFGNLIKHNATISGAQGGCQAEVGAAVAMGAAMVAHLKGLDNQQIEYAAEIGIEHHLGLTCDPIGGYVMIPCIERNAVGVLRAMDAAIMARPLSELREHKVSFDMVVHTMNDTGKKIAIELRETSLGGLATCVPMK